MIGSGVGLDRLMTSLSAIGADSLLTLPGVDDPIHAGSYMIRALKLLQDRGVDFDSAWSSVINRIQAPQGEGGLIEDAEVAALVKEERQLLEENRPAWRAFYERRPPTTRERALCIVATHRRLEGGVAGLGAKRAA